MRKRPPEKRWRSHASCAVAIGLRGNTIATFVPRAILVVCSAAIISGRNGSWPASGVVTPSKPNSSISRAASAIGPISAMPALEPLYCSRLGPSSSVSTRRPGRVPAGAGSGAVIVVGRATGSTAAGAAGGSATAIPDSALPNSAVPDSSVDAPPKRRMNAFIQATRKNGFSGF